MTSTKHLYYYPHYIFGYGSLICSQSRAITAPTLKDNRFATPVRIHGLQRIWSLPVKFRKGKFVGATFMGIRKAPSPLPTTTRNDNKNSSSCYYCNGVLIPVNDVELQQFDIRESGYERILLRHDQIEPFSSVNNNTNNNKSSNDDNNYNNKDSFFTYFDHMKQLQEEEEQLQQKKKQEQTENSALVPKLLPVPNVWVYVQKNPKPTSPICPIIQSYVDIIVRGCLSISKEFAIEFIQTTYGWHAFNFTDNGNDNEEEEEEGLDGSDDDDNDNEEDEDEKNRKKQKITNIQDTTYWVNDRTNPIYIRSDIEYSTMYGHVVDELLQQYVPNGEYKYRKDLDLRN